MAPRNRLTAVGQPNKRQNTILVIVLVLVCLFGARLIYVQAIAGPALAADATSTRTSKETIVAPRGEILDRNGTVLATTVETYDVRINLKQLNKYVLKDEAGTVVGRGAMAAAQQIATVIGPAGGQSMDTYVAELGGTLVGTNGDYRPFKGVTREVRDSLAALRIPGVNFEVTSRRDYPNGTTAAKVVGFVNSQGGATGLEQSLNEKLLGTNGTQIVECGVGGQAIPTGKQQIEPAIPGCDITLTLDTDLQYTAEQVVNDYAQRYGAQWASAVGIDPKTGKILFLADSGVVDPNAPKDMDGWRIHSVQDFYEPGSTGKVATVLSALEEGVVTPTTPIEDPYTMKTPNGQSFKDHSPHPDQTLTVTGVLAQSSNTGTINIATRMSDETRYAYMQKLGWTSKPNLGFANETAGSLKTPDKWDGRQKYTTMFGQGLAVSLVQNTEVFATVANGGVHVPPSIIDSTNCNGKVTPHDAGAPERVVSQESADQMIRMLESVTTADHATGEKAQVEGYRVAGKTGTAQVANGNGQLTDTVASFVGMAPADDPQLVIGVVVYKPTSGFFGGTIAAPIFSEIATHALPQLGIAPSTTPAQPYPTEP